MPIRIEDIPEAPQIGNPTLNTPGVRRPQIRAMDVSGAELDPSGLARTRSLLSEGGNDIARSTENLARATEGTKAPLLDPNTGQAEAQAFGNIGHAIGVAGNVVAQFAQKMADANDANTLAQASIAMDSAFAAHKDDIANNKFPETEWLNKWQNDRVPALEKTLDALNPSNRVKDKLQQNFAMFNAKAAVDIGAAATDRHLQIIGGNLLNAAELDFSHNHPEDAKSHLLEAVRIGALRPDQAQEKLQQMIAKSEDEQATFLTQSNPYAVIDDYNQYQQSGKSEIWPDARPSQINRRVSEAYQQKHILEVTASDSLDDSIASGEMTKPEQIQQFGNDNRLPQNLIDAKIRGLLFKESQTPEAQARYSAIKVAMLADIRQKYNPAADTTNKTYFDYEDKIYSTLPEGQRSDLLDELRSIKRDGIKPGSEVESQMVKMVTELHEQGYLNSAGYDPQKPTKIIDPTAAQYSAVAQAQLLNQIHEMIQKNPNIDPMEARNKIEDIIKPKITGSAASAGMDSVMSKRGTGWFKSGTSISDQITNKLKGQDMSGFIRSGSATPESSPTPGKPSASLDDRTIDFVKKVEGFNSGSFSDYAQTSIGYGTRAKPGEKTISKEEADSRLRQELSASAARVDNALSQNPDIKLNANQRAALISFDFNTGDGKRLIETSKSIDELATRLPTWNKVTVDGKKVVNNGLVNRRAKEMELFNA